MTTDTNPERHADTVAMTEPDYVVIRPAPDLPSGFLPKHYNGLWFDRSQMPKSLSDWGLSEAVAVATGRFEVRDDGAVAEIYEVRP